MVAVAIPVFAAGHPSAQIRVRNINITKREKKVAPKSTKKALKGSKKVGNAKLMIVPGFANN